MIALKDSAKEQPYSAERECAGVSTGPAVELDREDGSDGVDGVDGVDRSDQGAPIDGTRNPIPGV